MRYPIYNHVGIRIVGNMCQSCNALSRKSNTRFDKSSITFGYSTFWCSIMFNIFWDTSTFRQIWQSICCLPDWNSTRTSLLSFKKRCKCKPRIDLPNGKFKLQHSTAQLFCISFFMSYFVLSFNFILISVQKSSRQQLIFNFCYLT